MKRKQLPLYSLLFVFIVLAIGYFSLMPRWSEDIEVPLEEFSTERAFNQIQNLTKKPEANKIKLQTELEKLGLEVSLQKGNILTEAGTLTYSQNILARIKGTNSKNSILLLSHYDNAPSTVFGAANSGAGVATILESVRAFLYSKKTHTNDIIILFTDSKETGLNGAALFVTQHNWAKEIGIAIDIDAQGTAGPTYMNIETNQGNAGLVSAFDDADVNYPVGNSLIKSLLKKTIQATDLSLLKEKGNIQGYSLTLIDKPYNKQTPQDNLDNLDKNMLAHQASYVLPMLNYFSDVDLSNTNSISDEVFFSIPFGFIHYSYGWINGMLYLAIGLFLILLLVGVAKRILNIPMILRGILPLFGSFTTAVVLAYFGWKALLLSYPQYNDFANGFTYNGPDYIAAFGFLTLAICFVFYGLFPVKKSVANNYISPLVLGLIANFVITYYNKGGAFLIIPIYCGLVIFAAVIITQRSNRWLNLIMSIPALLIITPFIYLIPVVLGLKFLFASAIVIVILTGLIVPIFENWNKKGLWAFGFFMISIGFFIKANYNADYQNGQAKPNSLVYVYDADAQEANWLTYDKNLDDWTKTYLGEQPAAISINNDIQLPNQYNSRFTYAKKAEIKAVNPPTIAFLRDSLTENKRFLKIRITPNRTVNRYDILADESMEFIDFKVNGVTSFEKKMNQTNRKTKSILSYYVLNNYPLEMEFSIKRATVFDMQVLESSFDLLSNPLFNINARTTAMMPMPYVLTDAVCVKQIIKPSLIVPELALPMTEVPAVTPAQVKRVTPPTVVAPKAAVTAPVTVAKPAVIGVKKTVQPVGALPKAVIASPVPAVKPAIIKPKKVIKPVVAIPKPVVAPVVLDSL